MAGFLTNNNKNALIFVNQGNSSQKVIASNVIKIVKSVLDPQAINV